MYESVNKSNAAAFSLSGFLLSDLGAQIIGPSAGHCCIELR
jgi:hypothetical protein